MTTENQIANITISPDYFKRCAKNEYSNAVPWIWIREVIQNSSDAGAKHIKIETLGDSVIHVVDDGCGMNDDIIMNKLLTLGGSKKAEGSTGGFGKAKEVLFFAWDNWTIASSPNGLDYYYVDAQMIGNSPIRHEIMRTPNTWNGKAGTKITIQIDEEYPMNTWEAYIRQFVKSCTTKIEITLNGSKLETLSARGSKIEYDIATVIVNKSNITDKVYVRVNGITMFSRWLPNGIRATVTIDLNKKSTEILSSSRESIRYGDSHRIDYIISKVMINPKSVIKQANEGKVYIDKYMTEEMDSFKEFVKATEGIDSVQSSTIVHAIESIKEAETQDAMQNIVDIVTRIDPELGASLQLIINGGYKSELGYTYIVRRYKNKKPSMNPKSDKAQKIIHTWKRIVDKLMKQMYPDKTNYKVGLTFNPDERASYTTMTENEETTHYFLVNPTMVPSYSDYLVLGEYLYIRACHEATHVKHEDHNEDFATLFGSILSIKAAHPRDWMKLFKDAKEEASKINSGIEA